MEEEKVDKEEIIVPSNESNTESTSVPVDSDSISAIYVYDELKAKLAVLGLKEKQIQNILDQGVSEEKDMSLFTPEEIIKYAGCGLITAKKIVEAFVASATAPKEKKITKSTAFSQSPMDILPPVPDDISFLNMLKVGGVLKIGMTEIIAAIKAWLANQIGLYQLPKVISDLMQKIAEEQDEPCGPEFYSLQNLLIRRSYADIFTALEIDTVSVTQAKKDAFLKKIENTLWPALSEYHKQIISWVDSYRQISADPANMVAMLSVALASGNNNTVPIIQIPNTDVLHDAAKDIIDKINKVFASTGIVIARALAFDANKINEILENPALPAQVGASNHNQMINMLGTNVSMEHIRLERNITCYALSVLELSSTTAESLDFDYINALFTLGNAIPWDKLSSTTKEVESAKAFSVSNKTDFILEYIKVVNSENKENITLWLSNNYQRMNQLMFACNGWEDLSRDDFIRLRIYCPDKVFTDIAKTVFVAHVANNPDLIETADIIFTQNDAVFLEKSPKEDKETVKSLLKKAYDRQIRERDSNVMKM